MKFNAKQLQQMSNAARSCALGAVLSAQSGHIGIILDAAEIITVVFANHLRNGVDKFVLSAGHGSALLYSVLFLSGYNIGDIKSFRKFGGLPGHPEYGMDGVDATTGPLGQGVANAVGLALSQKIKSLKAYTYCLCSDGDLMEGISFEAISLAGRLKLNNMILLWDDNKLSIDGEAQTDIDICSRFRAVGWNVMSVSGDNVDSLDRAIERAKKSTLPVLIQCKNILGRGSRLANNSKVHGFGLNNSEILDLIIKNSSESGIKLWREVSDKPISKFINTTTTGTTIKTPKIPEYISTRELSNLYLNLLIKSGKKLIVGSSDLSGSTGVKIEDLKEITADNFDGNFIHYGVREHAMAAIMNGMVSGGLKTVGSTFLVFSDYMRPAIRLSAMASLPVIYVFSHDSICVGEDGPTHQPIEQLASLRMIPNLNVFRPCNITEMDYSWQKAIKDNKPSVLIVSRQAFKQINTPFDADLSKGAYIIYHAKSKNVKTTIIATGSEIPLAVDIASRYKHVQVVSVVNMLDFKQQSSGYKQNLLKGCVVAIEATTPDNWFKFADVVIGIDEFGKTGSGEEVYKHYGFDTDTIIKEIKQYLK
ncbi:MAG: transketolase [Alphaproteobacteria bacterium]|nr:transketolase [Alphaproteobacteria bacterium]